MSKLLLVIALVAIPVLLACSGGDPTAAPTATTGPAPTESPTATPVPTPVPTPTTAPEPTATPEPESMAAVVPTVQPPARVAASGRLVPLNLSDREAVASELSDAETDCISEVAGTDELLQFFAAPELASPEDQTHFLICLEDDTVTRMFLTGLIGESGPLSEEASVCIRSGMEVLDLRSVMLAGVGGDAGAAMTGSMSAFIMTLTCLNEAEWGAVAPPLGVSSEDREGMLCLLEALGGPEGLAEAMQREDEAAITAFVDASMSCGLPLESRPGR